MSRKHALLTMETTSFDQNYRPGAAETAGYEMRMEVSQMAWTPLPEKVKLRFETPQPHPMMLKTERTALVIVDMQNLFCNRNPESRSNAVIEGNVRLLEKARKAGVKVIFIQSTRTPDALEFTKYGKEPMLLEGTWEWEIVKELAPLPDEIVMRKYSHDPFARTELDEILIREEIVPTDTTIIVTGVSASVCANAACLGFSNRHYMTIIPMDCQASSSVEEEAMIFAKYHENSYAFTLSTMVEFTSGGMTTRQLVEALA
jgi:ureidoacrylate peracid hydrolase